MTDKCHILVLGLLIWSTTILQAHSWYFFIVDQQALEFMSSKLIFLAFGAMLWRRLPELAPAMESFTATVGERPMKVGLIL
jgi:hypothetical protein